MGGSPAPASVAATDWTKSGCWISRAETLTHRKSGSAEIPATRRSPGDRPRARTQRPIGRIAPFSSAISMKSPGGTSPALGVVPADERLDPGHRAGRERHDRLVDDAELAELDGRLELRAELVPLADRGVHARVEHREAGLAVGLGQVHRHVGVADEVGGGLAAVDGRWRCRCAAVTETWWPPIRYGARSSRTSRSAIAVERLRSGVSSVRTANSSPPSRATRSPSRTEPGDPLDDRDEERVAGRVAERVVDDLEVVEVDEEDRADRRAAGEVGIGRRGPARASTGTSGGWPRRSASRARRGPGRPEQDGVAEVERGDRAELPEDRCEPPRARRGGCRPPTSTTTAPTGRPSATIGATRIRPGARQEARRSGIGPGSRRRDRRRARVAPRQRDDGVRIGRGSSGRGWTPWLAQDERPAVARAEDDAPRGTRTGGEAVEDDPPWWTGSATSSSCEPSSTSASRSARRWRSSRSLIAEKTDVASAKSQKDVTLRTGIRSNSIAGAGHDVDRRDEARRLGVEHDEQQERVPERDLQPGPVRAEQRDARRGGGRAGTGAGSRSPPVRTSRRRGRRRRARSIALRTTKPRSPKERRSHSPAIDSAT